MTLPPHIPKQLQELLRTIAADFPALLRENLVGIYLWGSLTYGAFDESCSDVDCIVVAARDINECEFRALDKWFKQAAGRNRWVKRMDMRFVIDGEFLDQSSQCCGFYHYAGKLERHGSYGNPIMWMNIGESGITIWGKDAKLIAPRISEQCLNDALLLELNYLQEGLARKAGDRTSQTFAYNAYAVLTACRILYSARRRTLTSKERARKWAMEIAPLWTKVIRTANENRLKKTGLTTPKLEEDAMRFVEFVNAEVRRELMRNR